MVLAAAAGPAASAAPLPPVVSISSCESTAEGLMVHWEVAEQADYYELQLAATEAGQMFAGVATGAAEVLVTDVLPGSYYLRVRAHLAGTPSLGPGTWGPPGPALLCHVSEQPDGAVAATASTVAPSQRGGHGEGGAHATDAATFTMEVMRESEFTYDVDYLMNHNAGSVLGDSAFLTFSQGGPNGTSFLNVSFRNATFSLFCLEVLQVHVPNTITTGGNDAFADYVSCNDNGKPQDPQCECDNWIDRVIGGIDPNVSCTTKGGEPCGRHSFPGNCTCTCANQSLEMSAQYIGMMPIVFKRTSAPLGVWYSLPALTECREHELVGDFRAGGSRCTWKRRPDFRVARGWQVLAQGWNTSAFGFRLEAPEEAQVRQNAAAVRRTVAAMPLAPWRCGDEAPASPTVML